MYDYEICLRCNDIYEDRDIIPWCEKCKKSLNIGKQTNK